MVWKFRSVAAQEKHANLANRIEPTQGPLLIPEGEAQGESATAPQKPQQESRVEHILKAHNAVLAEHGILPDMAVPMARKAAVEPERVAVVAPAAAVEELLNTALNWDVPPFLGGPDELPDLMPVPPPLPEHPGLQFRNINTLGHALRLPADDERQLVWSEQRRDRGFDDTELWGLDDSFARFTLPRLKALRQQKLEAPSKAMSLVQWHALIDKMIYAFELLLPEGGGAWSRGNLTTRERSQLQEGLDLFHKYFFALCC